MALFSTFTCLLLLCLLCLPLLIPSALASGQLRFQFNLIRNSSSANENGTRKPIRAEICAREFRWHDDSAATSAAGWGVDDCKFGRAELTDLTSTTTAPAEDNINSNNSTASSSGTTTTVSLSFSHSWRQSFTFALKLWHDNELLLQRSERVFLLPAGSGWRSLSANFSIGPDKQQLEQLEVRFRVDCAPNFYGPGCDVRCELSDWERRQGRVQCNPADGGRRCAAGWTGADCGQRQQQKPVEREGGGVPVNASTAVSADSSSASECGCLNGGKCATLSGGGGGCVCPPGYRGQRCQLCVAHARCRGFCTGPGQCQCPEGKGGQFCEKDLVFCTRHSPCRNGGICQNSADGGYTCQCPPGFGGRDCERPLTRCDEQPCQNGADCVASPSGVGFRCQCPTGLFGRFCQVRAPDGCANLPCQNGGSCADLALLRAGSSSWPLSDGSKTKAPAPSSFKCLCADRWTGTVCDQRWEQCAQNPCQNGATCLLDPANALGFQCHCPLGWHGPLCAASVDDCRWRPCMNGGHCLDGHNAFSCVCPSGWGGELCQEQQHQHQQTPSSSVDDNLKNNNQRQTPSCTKCAGSVADPSPAAATVSLLLLLLAAIALLALLALLCLLQRLLRTAVGWPLSPSPFDIGGGDNCFSSSTTATIGEQQQRKQRSLTQRRQPSVAIVGQQSAKPWPRRFGDEYDKEAEAEKRRKATAIGEEMAEQPRYVLEPSAATAAVLPHFRIGQRASQYLEDARFQRMSSTFTTAATDAFYSSSSSSSSIAPWIVGRRQSNCLADDDDQSSGIYEEINGSTEQQQQLRF